jgi:hypothetical protein
MSEEAIRRIEEDVMVVQVQDFNEYPEQVTERPQIVEVASPNQELICPRCETQLRINYDEPQCLQCGYVDYAYIPPNAHRRKRSLMSTGTRYVLRYNGTFGKLADTLTHVQLRRFRNRAIYLVSCPFCHKEMTQSSLSGKRREVREERYKCDDGHRISLIPSKNGSLGWK